MSWRRMSMASSRQQVRSAGPRAGDTNTCQSTQIPTSAFALSGSHKDAAKTKRASGQKISNMPEGPMTTKTEFFYRTHFWNPDAECTYRLQCEAAGQPVILLVDETNGMVDCGGNIPKITYRLADFQRMGLPIYPNAERCLWQCGDYALYKALLATDADHLVIMEYDSIPAIDLLDVMKRVIETNVDFVAHQFAQAGPRWVWNESTIQWYQREVDPHFDLSKM